MRTATASRAAEPVYLEFDDNSLLPVLFGEHDRHLARIEQLLGVSITSRGNQIAISGPSGQAGVAKDALLSLHKRVRKGKSVDMGEVDAAVGQFAQPGTSLTMFVPDQIWVTANFKEIQLDHMRPGDPATLAIDAYPERKIHGHVESVQPGSGTAFSLLSAQNATGNYVKIVQRVPVKIILDNPPIDVSLGPGMSVLPTVRVDPSPSLYERLKARVEQWRRQV